MNPASRLYDFLLLLQKESSQNTKIIDTYKKVLQTDSIYRIFELLHFYQINLTIIEKELENSGKIDRYKQLLNAIKIFILPTTLEPNISQHKAVLNSITPQFMILADAFENPKYHENTIDKDLEKFIIELDKFLKNISNLEIDDDSKKILVIVVHKIKLSIDNYRYIGIEALQESLLSFGCILKKNEKSKTLLTTLINIVKKARETKEFYAFLSNEINDINTLVLENFS